MHRTSYVSEDMARQKWLDEAQTIKIIFHQVQEKLRYQHYRLILARIHGPVGKLLPKYEYELTFRDGCRLKSEYD